MNVSSHHLDLTGRMSDDVVVRVEKPFAPLCAGVIVIHHDDLALCEGVDLLPHT